MQEIKETENNNGYISYKKLWVLLEKKKLNQQYLIDNGIHRTSIYNMKNNKSVNMNVISNICYLLRCQPKDILEYVPENKIND